MILKKAMSFMLAAVVILGMTACGVEQNKGDDFTSEEDVPNPGDGVSAPPQTAAGDALSV